jgi:hypothetical protein
MPYDPGSRPEPEASARKTRKRTPPKRGLSREHVPDLAHRRVVVEAKREGTLGDGSPWLPLDPTAESAPCETRCAPGGRMPTRATDRSR